MIKTFLLTLVLGAKVVPPAAWQQFLAPFHGMLPGTGAQFRELQDLLRLQGHLYEAGGLASMAGATGRMAPGSSASMNVRSSASCRRVTSTASTPRKSIMSSLLHPSASAKKVWCPRPSVRPAKGPGTASGVAPRARTRRQQRENFDLLPMSNLDQILHA